MSDVTRVLAEIASGHPWAAEQLLPLVYQELRKLAAVRLAQENPGQTLQATALVHEAYLRLVHGNQTQPWETRGHFFAAAAEAMRRILVEAARRKQRLKRGGDRQRLSLDYMELSIAEPDEELLALDEALEKLEAKYPERAALVKLRYFGGLTGDEAALALGVSPATADRYWTYARAWLLRELTREAEG